MAEQRPVSPPYLDWRHAIESSDSCFTIPPLAEWIIEEAPSGRVFRAMKHCYDVSSDKNLWVPIRGTFDSIGEAQAAIEVYIASRKPVYLDSEGRVIRA